MSQNDTSVAVHSSLARRYPKRIMRYYEILKFNDIKTSLVDASDKNYWEVLRSSSHYIHHYVHRTSEMQVADAVLPVVDFVLKLPRFPNAKTSWHYDDKIKENYLLSSMNFPFAKSWIFYDLESALSWLENASFPLVYKLKAGAGSGNVLLLKTRKHAQRFVNKMFNVSGVYSSHLPDTQSHSYMRNLFGIYNLRQNIALWRGKIHYQDVSPYWQRHRDYIYFQEFLPDNQFDTRITVIGNRAFAYRRFNRSNDFRASGSGLNDYDQSAIDPRCIDMALQISNIAGFQSMAYDFMFDESGDPKIGEISYTYIDSYIYRCPGYYLGSSGEWVDESKWPQYWILADLLERNDLVEPSLLDTVDYVRPILTD